MTGQTLVGKCLGLGSIVNRRTSQHWSYNVPTTIDSLLGVSFSWESSSWVSLNMCSVSRETNVKCGSFKNKVTIIKASIQSPPMVLYTLLSLLHQIAR